MNSSSENDHEGSECSSVLHDDVQIFVERFGNGPRHLVFAHGWISSRRIWYEIVKQLPFDKFTCWLFDFRGCGLSDRPMLGHDLEGYASDLEAVLRQIRHPVQLVAHSMGARVAQFVACRAAPENLRSMILLAPGIAASTPPVLRHRELTEYSFGSRRRLAAFQRGAMVADVSPTAMNRLLEDALTAQREHWFGWYDAGRMTDFSAQLSTLALPIMVIAGEKDPLSPVGRIKREVVDKIRGAQYLELPFIGHNVPIEAADEMSRFIIAYEDWDSKV